MRYIGFLILAAVIATMTVAIAVGGLGLGVQYAIKQYVEK